MFQKYFLSEYLNQLCFDFEDDQEALFLKDRSFSAIDLQLKS